MAVTMNALQRAEKDLKEAATSLAELIYAIENENIEFNPAALAELDQRDTRLQEMAERKVVAKWRQHYVAGLAAASALTGLNLAFLVGVVLKHGSVLIGLFYVGGATCGLFATVYAAAAYYKLMRNRRWK